MSYKREGERRKGERGEKEEGIWRCRCGIPHILL